MARILLSAYACEPGRGSEPALGWGWATELARSGHQVWVLTRADNRPAIERDALAADPNLNFVYFDLPPFGAEVAQGLRQNLVLRVVAMACRSPHSKALPCVALRRGAACHLRERAVSQLYGISGHSFLFRPRFRRRDRPPSHAFGLFPRSAMPRTAARFVELRRCRSIR